MVKPTVLPLLERRLDPAFNNSRSSPISLATVRRNTADAAMQAAKEVAAAAATQTIWLLTLRNVLAHSFVTCVFAPQQLVQLTLLCVW